MVELLSAESWRHRGDGDSAATAEARQAGEPAALTLSSGACPGGAETLTHQSCETRFRHDGLYTAFKTRKR
jgi:hypothetical protein